ncbi:hypothetical protein DFP72DRAFT_839309 [Ephemerocybe angulata]|uniref:Uncharacterized protein n=1 Tax=Ephemerocybe angulata TaxID=980116 RepID=A0A8H6IH01_9AGAR|nr:hypothetical protein DFP72DRAFT_839309 [Tulosesus angulatus]
MQQYLVDEFYDMGKAVGSLDAIAEKCKADVAGRRNAYSLSDVNWDDIQVLEYQKPRSWRLVGFEERSGGMEETQFRVQGILVGKELPPVTMNGNVGQMRRARRYLRQHIRLFGGNATAFQEAADAIEKAYITFSGHFPDDGMAKWEPPTRENLPAIEVSSRYLTPRAACSPESVLEVDDMIDPTRALRRMMEDDFVHGPDNKVDYKKRIEVDGISRWQDLSPVSFKLGDIVEAVVAFVCYRNQQGQATMTVALRGLTLLDCSHRNTAAILRMKNRISMQQGNTNILKRRSAYDDDDEDIRLAREKMAQLNIYQFQLPE